MNWSSQDESDDEFTIDVFSNSSCDYSDDDSSNDDNENNEWRKNSFVCPFKNCNKIGSFAYPYQKSRRFCSKHKVKGMINRAHKRCISRKCNNLAKYGYANDGLLFCKKHVKLGLVPHPKKRCSVSGCSKVPFYNNESLIPDRCVDHRREVDLDLSIRVCKSCESHDVLNSKLMCMLCDDTEFKIIIKKNISRAVNAIYKVFKDYEKNSLKGNWYSVSYKDMKLFFIVSLSKFNIDLYRERLIKTYNENGKNCLFIHINIYKYVDKNDKLKLVGRRQFFPTIKSLENNVLKKLHLDPKLQHIITLFEDGFKGASYLKPKILNCF